MQAQNNICLISALRKHPSSDFTSQTARSQTTHHLFKSGVQLEDKQIFGNSQIYWGFFLVKNDI